MTDLIMKEIPQATKQQAESAARQIMWQFSIKETEIIGKEQHARD